MKTQKYKNMIKYWEPMKHSNNWKHENAKSCKNIEKKGKYFRNKNMSLEETLDALAARPKPRKMSIMIYYKKGKNLFACLFKTHCT